MPDSKQFFSPKEVSELCNLSRKQLRYYEKQGLITPVSRNENNNYRFYTQQHITQLFMIREYMLLGYTLQEIQEILDNNDLQHIRTFFSNWMDRSQKKFNESVLEYTKQIQKYRQVSEAIVFLEKAQLSQNHTPLDFSAQIENFPGGLVVYTTESGTPFDNQAACQKAISPLYILGNQFHLHFMGPLTYHFSQLIHLESYTVKHWPTQINIWFSIAETSQQHPQIKRITDCPCITAVHVGPYDDTLQTTYDQLLMWAKAHSLPLIGDSLEQYLIGSELTNNPLNYVTKIYLPIRTNQ